MSDIKVGVPGLLLCFEMSIFAILHLWAFPWKPYTLGYTKAPVTTDDASLDIQDGTYQGGFLGLKALFDAFNPWDLIKAISRSAKWLFVDRKRRHFDPSYQGQPGTSFNLKGSRSLQSLSPSPPPAHAHAPPGGAAAATSISSVNMASVPSDDHHDTGSIDRLGRSESRNSEGEELLSHAQPIPVAEDPYRPSTDIGVANSAYGYRERDYSGWHTDYEPYYPQTQR